MNKNMTILLILLVACGGYGLISQEQPDELDLNPKIIKMPSAKMAVVYTKGDPNEVAGPAMEALYGSVFQLRAQMSSKGVMFPMGAPRARWPNAADVPKEEFVGIWGLPIPDEAESIPQTKPDIEVKIETWEYGEVAQIIHVGPYETEPGTIKILMEFIAKQGYEIAGVHEEEYQTMPGADPQLTIIRYPVRKK